MRIRSDDCGVGIGVAVGAGHERRAPVQAAWCGAGSRRAGTPTSPGSVRLTGEIVDLVAAGIIDPAMVTRSALQNAASIAKNILTTEAIVAEIPDKQPGGGAGGMPDMSGMM